METRKIQKKNRIALGDDVMEAEGWNIGDNVVVVAAGGAVVVLPEEHAENQIKQLTGEIEDGI